MLEYYPVVKRKGNSIKTLSVKIWNYRISVFATKQEIYYNYQWFFWILLTTGSYSAWNVEWNVTLEFIRHVKRLGAANVFLEVFLMLGSNLVQAAAAVT